MELRDNEPTGLLNLHRDIDELVASFSDFGDMTLPLLRVHKLIKPVLDQALYHIELFPCSDCLRYISRTLWSLRSSPLIDCSVLGLAFL